MVDQRKQLQGTDKILFREAIRQRKREAAHGLREEPQFELVLGKGEEAPRGFQGEREEDARRSG